MSNHVRRKASWFEERMTRTNDGSPEKEDQYPEVRHPQSGTSQEGDPQGGGTA
jgi:hypothetical protein